MIVSSDFHFLQSEIFARYPQISHGFAIGRNGYDTH